MRKLKWGLATIVILTALSWPLKTVLADDSSSSSSDSNETKTNQWLTDSQSSSKASSSKTAQHASKTSASKMPVVESSAPKTKSSSSSKTSSSVAKATSKAISSSDGSTSSIDQANTTSQTETKPQLTVAQLGFKGYLAQLTSGDTPLFLKTTVSNDTVSVQLNSDQSNRINQDDLNMIVHDVADNLKAKNSHIQTVKFVNSQQQTIQKF